MTATSTRIKPVALPPEHGAWGFLLEPLLLGLFVAPSGAGIWLALGVIGMFLVRHPAKIAFVDRQRGRRYARTRLAERFTLAYGIVGCAGIILAVLQAGAAILAPFVLGAPLGVIAFVAYAQGRGRDLVPELAGAAALALGAFSVALAGDAATALSFALWVIIMARNTGSILYVRARLRLEKGQPASTVPAIGAHIAGTAATGALVAFGYAPWLALVALLVLLARTIHGLSPYRQSVRAQTIGFLEIGYGLLTVLLTAAGYALGI